MAGEQIIDARVKQKVDTEANWLANSIIILEGEQAFVVNDLGDPVNFKIGDGTKTFSELPYWINYLSNVISHKIIKLDDVGTPVNIPAVFKDRTSLYDVLIYNTGGGDFDLAIGTTDGGEEIGTFSITEQLTAINIQYLFAANTTIYLSGFDGNTVDIIIVYFDYNENPIEPPTGGEPTPFRYPKGHLGMFIPVGPGHLEECWDLITGLGMPGTAYENCQLTHIENDFFVMSDAYPKAYKTGDTIGGASGANTATITQANLPNVTLNGEVGTINQQRGNTGSRYDFVVQINSGGQNLNVPLGGSGVPISTKPASKSILYFLAITD